MKIAHLSTFLNGGAGIAAFRLHKSLMEHPEIQSDFVLRKHIEDQAFTSNNHIHTVDISRSYTIRARMKTNLYAEHLHWNKLNVKPKDYEMASFATTSFRPEVEEVVKNADIIHLHWVAQFINYPTFFNKIKQPIVWTLHDMNPFMGLFHYENDDIRNHDLFDKIDKSVRQQKIKAIQQHNNLHIICPSTWIKEKSEKSELLGKFPHYVIPNGLNLPLYPKLDKTQAKDSLNINNGLKTIFAIAQDINSFRKGGDILKAAIDKINTPFNLITIGGEPLKIGSNINHTHYNHIDDIERLNIAYLAADLTIIPSREDNLPNAMLESFINGTPVLSFGNGGMAEHVKTGYTGILEPNMNSEALADNIKDFIEDKYNFDSNSIRQYAIDNFSDKLQTERHVQLYSKILGI